MKIRAFVMLGISALAAIGCSDSRTGADSSRLCVAESAWPPETVVVAGTGALLPFARAVASGDGGSDVAVPESIGSSGGLAALGNGEIDVALTARRPSNDRAAQSWRVFELPGARVAVVSHPTSAEPLTTSQMQAIIDGEVEHWPNGSPLVFFLREPGDSSERAVAERWPEIGASLQRARQQRIWPVIYSDQAMLSAIDETPGALGIVDVGLAAGATNALQIVWPIAGPVRELSQQGASSLPLKPLFLVSDEHADSGTRAWIERALSLLTQPWYELP